MGGIRALLERMQAPELPCSLLRIQQDVHSHGLEETSRMYRPCTLISDFLSRMAGSKSVFFISHLAWTLLEQPWPNGALSLKPPPEAKGGFANLHSQSTAGCSIISKLGKRTLDPGLFNKTQVVAGPRFI